MNDKMLNIGPKSAAWLRQVGVRTQADLDALGAMATFMKVKRAGFRPSLNLLYALAGAERGCHWTALSVEEKSAMVIEVNAADDAAKLAKKFITPARDVTPERASGGDEEFLPASALFDDPDAGARDGDERAADSESAADLH